MTSKEAERFVNAQKVAAELEARKIASRWETEPEAVAYENATGKLEHLKGFLAGTEDKFNAYFIAEDRTHWLTLQYFQRELNQLSLELEYGPVVMPEDSEEEFEVFSTPEMALLCSYTRYDNGSICGVKYHAVHREQLQAAEMFVPDSGILGQTVAIEPVPSL